MIANPFFPGISEGKWFDFPSWWLLQAENESLQFSRNGLGRFEIVGENAR
jgi:hypothetical protein